MVLLGLSFVHWMSYKTETYNLQSNKKKTKRKPFLYFNENLYAVIFVVVGNVGSGFGIEIVFFAERWRDSRVHYGLWVISLPCKRKRSKIRFSLFTFCNVIFFSYVLKRLQCTQRDVVLMWTLQSIWSGMRISSRHTHTMQTWKDCL